MYSIKKIDNDLASKIWDESPNSSIYNNPEFLKFFRNIEIYGVYKGEELICCWPLKLKNKNQTYIPNFFYYLGPYWSKKILKIPNHSWLKYSSDVYELFLKKLTNKFDCIDFDLHYSLNDVRIFDWWNYNDQERRFKIYPKYTAIIENLKKKSENQIINNYRYVRRYELKHFKKYHTQIEECEVSLDEIYKLYFETIKINDEREVVNIKNKIETIYKITKTEYGKNISYRLKGTEKILCVMMLLFDNYSAHLVMNLAEREWKKKGIITWATHKTIIYSKEKNLEIFDFNGSNSPLRGDNKHSFGSESKLFFNLKYQA